MKHAPVLVVDIGNSSTDLGLYTGRTATRIGRMDTAPFTQRRIRATIRKALGERVVSRAVLASVVPGAGEEWLRAVRAICRCDGLLVDHRAKLGVPISYPRPETIGADRLANVCGAAVRFGTPVIVADVGTALTCDVVDVTRGFVGGVIAPGVPMMLDYLADRTAKLPRVKPGPVRRAVGRSTEEAMRIGARHGYVGLVREILQQLVDEVGARGLIVCATGGYAKWVLRGLDEDIRFVPNLTLFGLGKIGDFNEGL